MAFWRRRPREWHTMYTMQHHRRPPQAPSVLHDMVRSLAQRGGFYARTDAGEPGIRSLGQGSQRLHACISAVETHRTVHVL
jgi:Transposase Tn5 dimerisation domain